MTGPHITRHAIERGSQYPRFYPETGVICGSPRFCGHDHRFHDRMANDTGVIGKGEMMARRKPKAIDTRGPLQRIHDRQNDQAENEALAVLTPEMEAKGTYASSIHPSQGRRFVNNHDPVERWKAAGRLTQAQVVVIEMVQRLWRLAGLQQRLTASYGERMAASHGYELRALDEIEAREDLHRIQDYVPRGYWAVFEAVCRYGMSAGVSGELLGHGRNGAETRAHQVVCLVCDVVAMREGL